MADNKKFYWIKLKTDFFNSEQIDFLMSQDNGCQYVVLYQMLCLNTANNNGRLATNIGEMIVPYNIEKITRDTKYFNTDTVIVALELFKKLGLVYEEEHNILKISNFDEMVGSESKWAEKKRIYREKQKQLPLGQSEDIVRQEYRDKSIEYRDKSIDKEKDKEKEVKHKYGEYKNVKLTEKEYNSLISEYGSSTDEIITYLDEYIEMKGTKYKSCYLAIRKWVAKAVLEKKNGKETNMPNWFRKSNDELKAEVEPMTPEEIEEMEALQKELREKYGKGEDQ